MKNLRYRTEEHANDVHSVMLLKHLNDVHCCLNDVHLLWFASARADGRWMPARIRRLRPRHPQGGAATITYPTMGQQQFMVEPPSTSLTFPDFAAALNSLSLD